MIKTKEMFTFLLLINNSVTIGFSFVLLRISGIISSKTIDMLHVLPEFNPQYFYRDPAYYLNIQ